MYSAKTAARYEFWLHDLYLMVAGHWVHQHAYTNKIVTGTSPLMRVTFPGTTSSQAYILLTFPALLVCILCYKEYVCWYFL